MKYVHDLSVHSRHVMVRADFNVPLDAARAITDDSRIIGVLPTLNYLLEQQAKVILISHLGRPKGRKVPEMSLKPIAERLSELLRCRVEMAPDCIGPETEARTAGLQPGEVLLLENLRFHAGETENDPAFARSLASMCDVYVNDAFAVSHRENASVCAVAEFAPAAVAGLLLKKEIAYFQRALQAPERPLAAIVGGAKVSSKLNALKNLLGKVDKLIIGGAMANTFLKSSGCDVGSSLVEADLLSAAAEIRQAAAARGVRLYLPVDVVAAVEMAARPAVKIVPAAEIPDGWMALDIGPATVRLFAEALYDVKTIVWNGPMGVFEIDAFSRGTLAMVEHVAAAHALTIVGGGDTDAAVHRAGLAERISFISTGGGAFLALLEGKTLPGIAALERAAAANATAR